MPPKTFLHEENSSNTPTTIMRRIVKATTWAIVVACMISSASVSTAQTNNSAAPDAPALTALLKEFLAGASRNDPAAHERFWADDVIYTGSSGKRRNKTDIMHDVRSAPAPKPGDAVSEYTAEDVRIQQYGNAAIVAFRLVATTTKAGKSEIANYLNSGTFIKRKGRWQVVNWQSTKVPPAVENK